MFLDPSGEFKAIDPNPIGGCSGGCGGWQPIESRYAALIAPYKAGAGEYKEEYMMITSHLT
eukprot:8334511-Pyramimonas_sp.AAC.1